MIITRTFYDRLSSAYKKVIDKLEAEIKEICAQVPFRRQPEYKPIWEIIIKFAKEYFIPKPYWDYCIKLKSSSFAEKEESLKFRHLGYDHFYYNISEEECREYSPQRIPISERICLQDFVYTSFVYNYRREFVVDEYDMSYPHSCLEICFNNFERLSPSQPSEKILQKCKELKALHLQIVAADYDSEAWFKLILKADHQIFFHDSVKFRLGKNVMDIKLWKLYIEYLENHDPKEMLIVYSKYCRFFLGDAEMKKEYEEKMAFYGPVKLKWKNLFDFESARNENDKIEKKQVASIYQKQIFSFSYSTINHILDNSNSRILKKLYETCKYFYAKKRIPVCYRLTDGAEMAFIKDSIMLRLGCTLPARKICLSTSIYLTIYRIQDILPHLYRCDAKYIQLTNQDLTFDELKFLIGSKNVLELVFSGWLTDKYDDSILLQHLMEYLPKIQNLSFIPGIKVNMQTPNALLKLKFTRKIYNLDFFNVEGEIFPINMFLNFIIGNRDSNYFYLSMKFCKAFDSRFVYKLEKVMEDYCERLPNTNANIEIEEDYADESEGNFY